jgi:hypothetical protein
VRGHWSGDGGVVVSFQPVTVGLAESEDLGTHGPVEEVLDRLAQVHPLQAHAVIAPTFLWDAYPISSPVYKANCCRDTLFENSTIEDEQRLFGLSCVG